MCKYDIRLFKKGQNPVSILTFVPAHSPLFEEYAYSFLLFSDEMRPETTGKILTEICFAFQITTVRA